uniref:Polymerase/histidinol phosphatase N-terminal domain-containing protein n=1 Tax=Schlesneria paludicola TaxID=360056 RepID=A0A7C2NWZ8_9PLAN
MRQSALCLIVVFMFADTAAAQTLAEGMRHLRSGAEREWLSFPERAGGSTWEIPFAADANAGEWTLHLRQQDVKQTWQVLLNDQPLGEMVRDENDIVIAFAIPEGRIVAGKNRLTISSKSPAASDDIRVGQIRLDPRPLVKALGEGALEIEVRDAASQQPLPCRITFVNADGALPQPATTSSPAAAIRQGVAYLANGRAKLELPAGKYTVFAGRGFEYSLDRQELTIADGQTTRVALTIRRVVPTDGYVACDTHVHTLTHSGHGDATIDERMLTIAGEGIELPIATDHNKHIDYEPTARQLGVRDWFTPVMGNEVTTPRGHFNIFPVGPNATPPNHRLTDWTALFADIFAQAQPKIVILNHARDLHSGVRPFGPKLFNAAVAEHDFDWPADLNAMEVVNSGATQTDPLRLFHDWMALLNRGRSITPIGSSDSHDVARHFIGQGRTYIRCDDRDPGRIPVADALDSLAAGRVMVSYGLLAELTVDERYRSGDLVPSADGPLRLSLRVLAPDWVQPRRVLLFANGQLIREETIEPNKTAVPGVPWSATWEFPRPKHDGHLVAIAVGEGIDAPYWRTAKPYQPLSQSDDTVTLGCSGAVWLDGDGDGRRTSARDYAERLVTASNHDLPALVAHLADYDAAVAAQVAHLLEASGRRLATEDAHQIWRTASPAVRDGFQTYLSAVRDGEIARTDGAAQ